MGESPDPAVREEVMWVLYYLDTERAFPYLAKRLEDSRSDLRWGAIELLGYYGPPITPLLIPLLRDDPDVDVRSMAAGMLGNFGTPEALPALRWSAENDHAIDCQDTRVSSEASHAIKEIETRNQPGAPPVDLWAAKSLHRPELEN